MEQIKAFARRWAITLYVVAGFIVVEVVRFLFF